MTEHQPDLESEIRRMGRPYWEALQGSGRFGRDVYERILRFAMDDQELRFQAFRFVDLLPSLRSDDVLISAADEFLAAAGAEGRRLAAMLSASRRMVGAHATAFVVRKAVATMARRFIASSDLDGAMKALHRARGKGIGATVDLLGEATLSELEADRYAARYRALIARIAEAAEIWPPDEVLDANHAGRIPRGNVSLKISALAPYLDPIDIAGAVDRLRRRVIPLLELARDSGVFVNFDMESWELHEITMRLFEEAALHDSLRNWRHLGIVVQGYLAGASGDVDRLTALAEKRSAPITIRLVKGAYWDYETVRAELWGYRCPVLRTKEETDANFEKLTRAILDRSDRLWPAFGSHNLRSIVHAVAYAERIGLPQSAVEIQMLYGMADTMGAAFRNDGYRVRQYVPVGELLPGMSYLVRRLLENTSNVGFLKQSAHGDLDYDSAIACPLAGPVHEPAREAKFRNAPLSDFTVNTTRIDFAAAIESARTKLPIRVPVVVGGERRSRPEREHFCPSRNEIVATRASMATASDVDEAISLSVSAYPSWRDLAVGERSALIERLADRIEADRMRLAAIEVFEEAKPWREADADVAEAIDFCRYYAWRARKELSPRCDASLPGEANTFAWEGRGPTAVIAPWNFPLAIICGMSSAALVAGNPVLLKPAEQSSAVAFALYEHMEAAGFPANVAQFLPGLGEEVGRRLVLDPRVAQIAFTGSRAVGLSILESAGKVAPGQREIKHVVCEMGGKNAIIVAEDADIDEAIQGIVASAFGYAGQKCSAASRLIVVGEICGELIARLIDSMRSLRPAPADDPASLLGPVIDEESCRRLLGVIDHPGEGAKELFIGERGTGGWFVPPALFEVSDPGHRLMSEEFFGPILCVHRVSDLDTAFAVANASEYGLTGAIFARIPSTIERARRELRVGNLYINRKCTGAMVHRQPFGGRGMSGAGTKAGGPAYLYQFARPRATSENTMRHGFSPEISK